MEESTKKFSQITIGNWKHPKLPMTQLLPLTDLSAPFMGNVASDEMLDLNQKASVFSREYLNQFKHFAIDWDSAAKSSNLNLSYADQLSGGVIIA